MHIRFAVLAALALVAISSVVASPTSQAYPAHSRAPKRAAKYAANQAAKYGRKRAAKYQPQPLPSYTPPDAQPDPEDYTPVADDTLPSDVDATSTEDDTSIPTTDDTSAPTTDDTSIPTTDDTSTTTTTVDDTSTPIATDDSTNYTAPTPADTTYAGNNRIAQIVRQVLEAYKSRGAVPARCHRAAKQPVKKGAIVRYACAHQLHAKPARLYQAMAQLTATYKIVRIRSRADGKYVEDLSELSQRTGSWTIEWGAACAQTTGYAGNSVCLRFFVDNQCQPGMGDAYEGTEPVQNESAPY